MELILQKRLFSQRMLDFWLQDKMPEYYFYKKIDEENQEEKGVGRRRGRGGALEGPGWGVNKNHNSSSR